MIAEWPTVYTDARGREETVIKNDGRLLRVMIRGVKFSGYSWPCFEPDSSTEPEYLARFAFNELNGGALTGCVFDTFVPMVMLDDSGEHHVSANVRYELTTNAGCGWIGPTINVSYHGRAYTGEGWETFEYALLRLQRQLPLDVHLKCCFGCALSSYNPRGDGDWGMLCYRNYKREYSESNDVKQFVLTHNSAEGVQETYLCPEFQPWNGKSGYRDPLYLIEI